MMRKKAAFITLEGGEGAGKTTVLQRLAEELRKKGYDLLTTREPGGIKIAEEIRSVILNVDHTEIDSRTEALLYAAARRQHLIEKIIPALEKGKVVLCDRFIHSSLAYQGYARGIGIEKVKAINEFAIANYFPDVTLLFDLEPRLGLERIAKDEHREINRLDKETVQFHERVREGFLLLANEDDTIKIIDASQSLDEVTEIALSLVLESLS